MRHEVLVATMTCLAAAIVAPAGGSQRTSTPSAAPGGVAALLAKARASVSGSRSIEAVTGVDASGTETQMRDVGDRTDPYEIRLRWPDTLEMRSGPVLHTLTRGVYGRRLADDRYGGPMVERLMANPASIKEAAARMPFRLMSLSLMYLLRTPPSMTAAVRDAGLRDFGYVHGQAIEFEAPGHVTLTLVLDIDSAHPLAIVVPVRTTGPNGAIDDLEVSVLQDYADVSGVRLPHRIDAWTGGAHSRIAITRLAIDTLR